MMIMMMMIKIMILFNESDDDYNAFNNILVTAVLYEVRCGVCNSYEEGGP